MRNPLLPSQSDALRPRVVSGMNSHRVSLHLKGTMIPVMKKESAASAVWLAHGLVIDECYRSH